MISYTLHGFVKRVFPVWPGLADRGEMTASVAEVIADRVGAMPAGERRAAQALVANYPLVGLKTVAEFSQAAGVSSPTILRFVARLGFHNYAEFQAALQDELAAQLQCFECLRRRILFHCAVHGSRLQDQQEAAPIEQK